MQGAFPFVPAKDPAQSEAYLEKFPSQYLPEVCFQHLSEKFIMMAKNKIIFWRERKSSIIKLLASAIFFEREGKKDKVSRDFED